MRTFPNITQVVVYQETTQPLGESFGSRLAMSGLPNPHGPVRAVHRSPNAARKTCVDTFLRQSKSVNDHNGIVIFFLSIYCQERSTEILISKNTHPFAFRLVLRLCSKLFWLRRSDSYARTLERWKGLRYIALMALQ